MIRRAALYARVSTARQEQEQTVGSQLAALKAAAAAAEVLLADEHHYVDEGYSGSRLDAPRSTDFVTLPPKVCSMLFSCIVLTDSRETLSTSKFWSRSCKSAAWTCTSSSAPSASVPKTDS